MSVYCNENIESAVNSLTRALHMAGLEPGNEIYVIRGACYECPEKDDHCQIDCKKKDKKYLEKNGISKVRIMLREDDGYDIEFEDTDGNTYQGSDIGKIIFTNREEALIQL